MATADELFIANRAGGRISMAYAVKLTMAAGATVTDSSFTPPAGSRISKIAWHTATGFTGSPTNIYLTVGQSAGDNTYVANTDVKSATSPTACTLANSADYDSYAETTALFCTLTANGGTNPAGSCTVVINYEPPNPSGGNQPFGIN